jgi:hypothetical protein
MGNVAEMQHAIYIYKEYGAPSQVVLFYLNPVYIIFSPQYQFQFNVLYSTPVNNMPRVHRERTEPLADVSIRD